MKSLSNKSFRKLTKKRLFHLGTQQYYQTIDDHFYNDILPRLIYLLTKYENNLLNVSYAVKAEYFDKVDVTNQTQVARTAIDVSSKGRRE